MSRIGEYEKTIIVEPLEEPIPTKEIPKEVPVPLKKLKKNL
ncbi:MAG: hypothetical protein AB1606_08170 [Nitrospirota bacterium]